MDARVPFAFVVIEESDRFETVAGFEREFMGQDSTGIARPNNADTALAISICRIRCAECFAQRAQRQTHSGESHQTKNKIHCDNAPGRCKCAGRCDPNHDSNNGGDREGMKDAAKIRSAEVAKQRRKLMKEAKER